MDKIKRNKIGKYKSEHDPWGSLYFPEKEDKVEICYECQVCYRKLSESQLIAINGIEYHMWHRVFPWHICFSCAEKIRGALEKKEGMNE